MGSFWDRVDKVNSQKQQNKQKESASFWDRVDKINSGSVKVSSKLDSTQVDEWFKNINNVGQRASVYLKQDGYKKPNSGFVTEIDKYLESSGDIEQYLRANKTGYKDYDSVIKSYFDTVNSLKSLRESIDSTNKYFSQYASEDDYIWKSGDTADARQQKYKDNQTQISELEDLYDQAYSIETWYNSYRMNPNAWDQETVKKNMDIYNRLKQYGSLDDLEKEIDRISVENTNYERGNNGYVSKVVDDYDDIRESSDFEKTSANRNYSNPTRDMLTEYDSLNDSSTWYFDANGVYRDAYGNKLTVDASGNWVNPNAQGDQYKVVDRLGMYLNASDRDILDATGTAVGAEGAWATIIKDGVDGSWKELTENEIAIYYYLLNSSGQETADKYLSDMKTELNRRETTKSVQSYVKAFDDASFLERIALNIATVPAKLVSGVAGTIQNVADTLSGNDINPYSQAYGGLHFGTAIQGEQAKEFDKTGIKIPGLNFTLGDAYQSGMSILESYASIGIGGRLGGMILASSVATSEAQRLYEQGASREQIAKGSAAAGLAEMVFESIGIDNLLKIKDVDTLGGMVMNILKQAGTEGLEEMGTEIANTVTNAIIMGTQSDWQKLMAENGGDWKGALLSKTIDVINAGIGGMISGLGTGTGASISSYASTAAQQYDTGKSIQYADGGVDALKQLANQVAGVSDSKMKNTLTKQAGKVTSETATGKGVISNAVAGIKNISNTRNVGRLYSTVNKANNLVNASANKADITKSLVRKGISTETATDLAEAIVASYNGQELTKSQERLLESASEIKAVQEAISNIVANTASTMGQRSKNIRDFDQEIYSGVISKAIGADSETVKANIQKAFTPEGSYDVSVDGKAIRTGTGDVIDIKGVASIRNGEMLLDIGDGKTINAKDVSYASNSQALVYEAVANLGDNINAETANKLISQYKGGDAMVFARGMAQAYTYGFYGYDRSEMLGKNSLATELTEAQRNFAYGLGEQYRPSKDLADKAKARISKAPAEKGVYYRGKDGTVTDFRSYEKDSKIVLKDVQKTAIETMEKLSKALGVRFNVYETWVENGKRYYLDENGVKVQGNPNGFYDTRTGEIYIDLNAGNDYQGTMLFTIAHELTHYMRQWSPEHFTKIAGIVFKHGGMKDHVSELVAAKQAKAKAKGKHLSYDTAMEEVVADGMETILKDGKVMEFMAEVKQKDRTAWEKLKEWFKNLAEFLKDLVEAYSGHSAQTTEGAMVAAFSKDLLSQIEQIWAEGAVAAGENYQTSLTPGEEGTVVNQNGDPVAHATEDGTVQLSMRTYEEDGRAQFRKYLDKCVTSKKLTKAEMQEMLDGIEDIYQTCKAFKDKYAPFSTWSDAAVVRDTYGKPVFSVVTPNGDYKMNLDFSLVCKKRRTLDAVFNEMTKRGIIDDFELGQKSVVKINEIIRRHGLETACALCFVDAKRFRQASMADQFTSLYNELVLSLVPEAQKGNIDHFNFSGYETIKKVDGGIDTWDNAKLDFSHINHVLKTYGDGTVEYKAAKYIKTHAEGRKLLLRGDFMSSKGFDAVKTQNQDILKLYNSKKGTGGPKAAFGDVQYMNEVIKKARFWTPAKAYAVGGIRIQSFSDYVPRMVFDYVQMVYDLAATKLPAHAYTKEALFVKQFGLTGIKINMSLIPAIAEGGIAPGLDANGDYVWAGESFDFETAKEIQNAEGYTENCGTICVGVSKQHILKLLSDPNIRMVIPYHKSGLNPIVAHMNKIAEFTDYTTLLTNPGGCQNTMDKNGNKVEVDFNFNEVLRKTGDPKATVRQYLDWCAKNEYTPRFAEFAWHENYYKLIEDFTLYDKDGKFVPQREVRAVFPKADSAFGSMKDLIQEALEEDAIVEGKRDKSLSSIVDEIQQNLPKTEAEIAEEQVAQADRDLEASETKLSIRETFYKEFDAWDKQDTNVMFTTGTTSDALLSVGMKDQEIVLRSGTVLQKIKDHPEMTFDIFKKIPELLEHPVIVQFSDAIDIGTKRPKYDSSITVLGELYADVKEDGKTVKKPVLVSLELLPTNKKKTAVLDFAIIKSAYSKNALQQYLNENSILYIDPDKKRTDSWLSLNRLQLPLGEKRYGPVRKIAYVDGKVKVQSPKNMTDMQKKLFEAGKIDEFGNKLFSDRDNVPTFYSHMAKVVDGLKQEKFGAASLVSTLTNRGVKVEEIKWSGIETFLEGKKSVTKAELQEFIAGSMLQIEEEVLDNKDRPYTDDQQKRLDEYEAKRDEIAKRLADEWKKITGEEFPIRNPGAGLESSVSNAIIDANKEQKDASFEGRLLKKLRKDLEKVIANNDDFGFDSWKDALRSIHRHRKDFIKSYEMSTNDKAIIVKYCNALNAYNELPNKITDADSDKLRGIARETDPWTRKIMEVKHEHNEEEAKYMTNWKQYSLDGGKNYREMLFRIPGSTYSNDSMFTHWKDRVGVLAHARVQDMDTFIGKMLFIEEIQSDWHNEGRKEGYRKEGEKTDLMLRRESEKAYEEFYAAVEKMVYDNANWEDDNAVYSAHPVVVAEMFDGNESYFDQYRFTEEQRETIRKMVADEAARQEAMKTAPKHGTVPDAPFKDNYHEYVLKRLLREAAEQDYDSIGWTTAEIQDERWQNNMPHEEGTGKSGFLKAYIIEYDQKIRKFLGDFGKKWGTKVGKTVLDNGIEVWSMAITDEMKDSVMTEGQTLYSERVTDKETLNFLENQKHVTVYRAMQVIDGKLYPPMNAYTYDDEGKKVLMPSSDFNVWEQSTERPDLIDPKTGKFKLDKGKVDGGKKGTPVPAAYNPYIHTSLSMLNDQFTSAYQRSNLVVVKGVVPESELTSGYHAQYAKDSVGETEWHSGVVSTQLPSSRKVILSRWFKPIEIVPNDVVAANIKDMLAGTDIEIPYNVVSPGLRRSLEKIGVPIGEGRGIRGLPSKDEVKYQDRDTDSVSNRSLLANALEGAAKNEIEKNKIQEYKGKISLINAEERKLHELNEKIKDLSFAKGPKDTKAIRDLQFEARQTANRISTYDKQLLRLEATQPLQDVLTREKKLAYQRAEKKGKEALEAYREKTLKTQRELLEKWQESRKKGIDSRNRTAMRHKIKDVVNELNQYLLRGTKDRHVPIELQKAVAEALDAVNMDTVGAEERIAKLKDELLKAKTPEQIQEISRKIDHIQQMGDRMNGRLQKLKDAYDQFVNSDDPMIANSHDEVISNKLQSVIDSIGNTPLRDMNLAQLEDVYDMYRMVLTTIRNANKAFKAKKSESISTIANRVMMEVEKVGGKKKLTMKGMDGVKGFIWNNLKPVYAFEHIGSDSFTEVFNSVRSGEDVWAVDVTEAREFYLDKSKKHGYNSWDLRKRYNFKSTSGMDFSLDLEQIMSLYAYSKRDQAADHLKKGGIVIDETTEITMKNKLGIPVKFNPTEATAYNISDATLAEIISKLSKEQKEFVDEMQAYLSDVMGAKGNEVSLEMYGIKLFKEKFYFPLKSAHQFMAKAKEQQKGEVKIKNSGFSKETVQKASNPIVLTPFMNVWSDHVNEMSMYHAFVLPMEDFYRVYNYKTPTSETMATESVEMFIQNAYGKGATKYIDQLLKDLNGGARTDSTTGIINKMMGLFKKGSVFASLSVVVQQPSAIARAAALVDMKYFIGPKVDHKRHKALWDEVKQYAPVAIIKEMGYFDTNMGKSTQDFITGKEYSGFKEKMTALVKDSNYRDELLSKAPALADELAWCSIWEAVKREMQDQYPGLDVKFEPFLMLAGSRFTEVITKTQVYDSVLSRSALMRSKDTGMKMATAFMAEPTTSINMIADALLQGKRGNRKYARTAIGAVIASQILNSILVSFVYAGRDDDEDETYWEKYIGTLTGEVLDSLNPAGYIPFLKDIMSIVQGYDVERSDMAVVSDLWKAWENLSKDTMSTYRKVEGFAGSIAQIFGLPVKNIMRDVRGIYQTIMSFVNGQQTTASGIGYAIKGAITGKDVSDQQQLYEAYLRGDTTHIARVESRYKNQSAINSAIRKALRENDPRIQEAAEAKFNGNISEYTRIAKEIIADGHFSQDNVVAAINAVINSLDKGETTSTPKASGLYKAEDFAVAIAQGDQAMANAIKVDIIRTAQKNGKTAEEAEKSFVSSATSACKELFLGGEISESKAVAALEDYFGKTEDEAMADVQYWAFKQAYPDVYADDAWFDKYYEDIADSGIEIDTYMEYRNAVKDITGEGKKERRLEVIDSMPITSAQKDALYYAEGWAASTLNEAPWH